MKIAFECIRNFNHTYLEDDALTPGQKIKFLDSIGSGLLDRSLGEVISPRSAGSVVGERLKSVRTRLRIALRFPRIPQTHTHIAHTDTIVSMSRERGMEVRGFCPGSVLVSSSSMVCVYRRFPLRLHYFLPFKLE